ncbi:hypothetical protein AKO1_013165 [Acrasis kona]|uniref:Uncharacterized protein n=1 Tax=Acrasis kona TaxID=1008807 RepID=A0AAW2YWY3_9EUKA
MINAWAKHVCIDTARKPNEVGISTDPALLTQFSKDPSLISRPPFEKPKELERDFSANAWFKINNHHIYTMRSNPSIDLICLDFKRFVEKYFFESEENQKANQKRQSLAQQGIRHIKTKNSTLNSRMSIMIHFINWVYVKTKTPCPLIDYFRIEHVSGYHDFICKDLQLTKLDRRLELFDECLVGFINHMSDSWLNINGSGNSDIDANLDSILSFVSVKKKDSRRAVVGGDISEVEFCKIEQELTKILTFLDRVWFMFSEHDYCETIFHTLGWWSMEGQCWAIYFHLRLYGIQPSHLLQICRDNIYFRYKGEKNNVASFEPVVQLDGTNENRFIHLGYLSKQLSNYLHFRLPFVTKRAVAVRTKNDLPSDSSAMFYSTLGASMNTESFHKVLVRFYGQVLNKYATTRTIRNSISSYCSKHSGYGGATMLSFLLNHAIRCKKQKDRDQNYDPTRQATILDKMIKSGSVVNPDQEVIEDEDDDMSFG